MTRVEQGLQQYNQRESERREAAQIPEVVPLKSGKNVFIFRGEENQDSTSWLALDKEGYVAQARFTDTFVESPWFAFRFPHFVAPPREPFLLAASSINNEVLNPDTTTLTVDSARFQPYELLEETGSKEETAALVEQKKAVKDRLIPFAQDELEKVNQGQLSHMAKIADTSAGSVYVLEIPADQATHTKIPGDTQSSSQQFNPQLRLEKAVRMWNAEQAKTRKKGLPDTKPEPQLEDIQLLKEGDITLLVVDADEHITFYSPRWGRVSMSHKIEEWKLGEGGSIKSEVEQATAELEEKDRHRVRAKIVAHLVRRITHDGNWTVPTKLEREEFTIENYIKDKTEAQLARIRPFDTQSKTLEQWIANEWLPAERNKVHESVKAELEKAQTGESPRYKSIQDFYNQRLNILPEGIVEAVLNNNLTAEEQLMVFALYESSLNLQTYIDQLQYAASLMAMGIVSQEESQPAYGRHMETIRELQKKDQEIASAMARMGEHTLQDYSDEKKEALMRDVIIYRQAKPIRERLLPLIGSEHRVKNIGMLNIHNMPPLQPGDTFVLAAQFCPLYTDDERPLNEFARLDSELTGEEEDILRSAVGPKWMATKAVVREIKEALQPFGVNLRIQARFGDIGAVVSKPEWADPALLEAQADLYERHLRRFCEQEGIELDYGKISDHSQDDLPPEQRVPQYIIVEDGKKLDQSLTLEEYMRMLGLDINALNQSQKTTLARRLIMSDYNFDLAAGLTNTYIHLLPKLTQGAHAQLGMELSDIYLALSSATPDKRQANLPAINILAG